jgi:hypothetical protein
MRARLVAAALLALLAGCSPTPPTPSVTGLPSPIASQSVRATDAQPAATFGPDNLLLVETNAVTVVVDRLAVRADPLASADSPGDLTRGDVAVLMVFEPIEVNGTTWYYAKQVPTPDPGRLPDLPAFLPDQEFPLAGWIAATDETGATVKVLPPRCPSTRDLANVSAMLPGEQLACFGADSLTLEGTFTCDGCPSEDPGTWEPAWLAGGAGGRLSEPSLQESGRVLLHLPPSIEAPAEDARVRAVGHFDDPQAATCRIVMDGVPIPERIAVGLCRQAFVVVSFTPVSVEEIPPPE